MTAALFAWFKAFAFTQAFEVPIYLRATGGSWKTALLASTITHPVVWFVFPSLLHIGFGYWGMIAGAEVFAVVVEAWWLHRNSVPRALLWAFIANATSATGGLLLRHLGVDL